jgi:hypothetical protein
VRDQVEFGEIFGLTGNVSTEDCSAVFAALDVDGSGGGGCGHLEPGFLRDSGGRGDPCGDHRGPGVAQREEGVPERDEAVRIAEPRRGDA